MLEVPLPLLLLQPVALPLPLPLLYCPRQLLHPLGGVRAVRRQPEEPSLLISAKEVTLQRVRVRALVCVCVRVRVSSQPLHTPTNLLGLRKVTNDMKTHKNPELRASSVVKASDIKPSAPTKAAPKFGAAAAKKKPVCELQGKKWVVVSEGGREGGRENVAYKVT